MWHHRHVAFQIPSSGSRSLPARFNIRVAVAFSSTFRSCLLAELHVSVSGVGRAHTCTYFYLSSVGVPWKAQMLGRCSELVALNRARLGIQAVSQEFLCSLMKREGTAWTLVPSYALTAGLQQTLQRFDFTSKGAGCMCVASTHVSWAS